MGIFKLVRAMQERCSKPAFDNVHLVAIVVVSYFLPSNSDTTTIVFTNNQEREHQLLSNYFHVN